MCPILKPNTYAQILYFLSHSLRSLVYASASICWRYLRSSYGESRYPRYNSEDDEGTGTCQDYLVNRDDQKSEGPFGEKNARKSRNCYRLKGRDCGCIRDTSLKAQFDAILEPNKNAQRMSLLSHLLRPFLAAVTIVKFSCALSNRESRYPRDD